MTYRNDATERARLHRLWITEQDKPCVYCGSKVDREIHHHNGDSTITNEDTCCVACRVCHRKRHPHSKFRIGDKVRLRNDGNLRRCVPSWLDFTDYEKSRPRTIVEIEYSRQDRCNYYTLGSNAKGSHFATNGQPLDGFSEYKFRSYQLIAYIPRRYHFIRPYHRKNVVASTTPLNQNPEFINSRLLGDASKRSCCSSPEIIGK